MRVVPGRRTAWLLLIVVILATVPRIVEETPLAQSLSAIRDIPGPQPVLIRPRLYAGYGALIGAALLGLLYLYRGRTFILYWVAGWLLMATSMAAPSLGARVLGAAALNVGALCSVWAAGLFRLAPSSFPNKPMNWRALLKTGIASAVWFAGAPFVLAERTVLATGYLGALVLLVLGTLDYYGLARRTHYIGAYVLAAATLFVALSNIGGAALMLNLIVEPQYFNALLGFNIVMNIFAALGMHVLVFEDMTEELRTTNRELAAANEEVRRLAITDPLTGCYNRRSFEEIERRELVRHRRYQSPLAVVFVDIDHFKHVNDTLGHDTGDAILRTIGAFLRARVRETDYAIRWGGDEFVLLLACTHAQAEWKASELKLAWHTDQATTSLPGAVRLSMGVSEVPPDAESLAAAISRADERMYLDKSNGRTLAV